MKKRIVILGGGESGVGAAMLGKQQGYDVFLSDAGFINEKYKVKARIFSTSKTSAANITFFRTEMPISVTNVLQVCWTRTGMLDPNIHPSIGLAVPFDSFTCKPPF